jgi:hypothetical protein
LQYLGGVISWGNSNNLVITASAEISR